MDKVTFKERVVESDVLCIGGGIAGLMAAIRAAEKGARVIVADKANVKFSGAGATGNDHFMCYIPEVHGSDFESWIQEFQLSQQATLRNKSFIRTWLEKSFEIVQLWDKWGIPMKYNGNWEFAGHGMPGQMLTHLHYAGKHQKKILTKEAKKRGAEIINRVMCFDLLGDAQGVTGALGMNTREDELVIFNAKAIILATGSVVRLYPGPTPAWLFNTRLSPTCVGDGRAMAFRAGAELASMELPVFRCGPVYFARAGKATWAGVLRDPSGKPVGPFVTKPDNKYGDPVVDIYQDIFMDYKKNGRGPVYMDCDGLSDEALEYMEYWLRNEGNAGFLDHLAKEGIDIRKHPIEFRSYDQDLFPRGGVLYDDASRTSLNGLYAAGDEFFGGISCAAVFGWIAGENAARDAGSRTLSDPNDFKTRIDKCRTPLEQIRNRRPDSKCAHWKEANIALQQIMTDFAGSARSETMLGAGDLALKRLKSKSHDTLFAANPHELTRVRETLNLIDLGEIIVAAARERKETRGKHVRSDYPFTHPMLSKLLIIKKSGAETVTDWRNIKN